MNKLRVVYASAIAAIISIFFTVAITISAEEYAGLKNWLKSVSGHHWQTKSYLSVLVWAVFAIIIYRLCNNVSAGKVRASIFALIIVILLGYLALLGFYWVHFFGI